MPSFRKLIMYFLLTAGLAFFANSLITPLANFRDEHHLNARSAAAGVPPIYALADGLFGGFRGFLITSLWERAEEKKDAGDYYEMVDIYKIIAALEPNYPNAWAYMAWNLSYNVAAALVNSPRDRVYWVFRGIALVRDEGIRRNPHSALLYEQLSWLYYNKIARSADLAFPLYRQYLSQLMAAIIDGSGKKQLLEAILTAEQYYCCVPDFLNQPSVRNLQADLDRLQLGDLLSNAYPLVRDLPTAAKEITDNPDKLELLKDAARLQMGAQLRVQLNMEPAIMWQIANRFGDIDWRLAGAHSLYWAWCGQNEMLALNPNYDNEKFIRLVYLSLIQLAFQSNGIVTNDGMIIAAPNPEMTDALVQFLEDYISEYPNRRLGGIKMALDNFLFTTIFNYYFADDLMNAERMRQKLITLTGKETEYGGAFKKFLQTQTPEFFRSLDDNSRSLILVSFCDRAYRYLIAGDVNQYREQLSWFDNNYPKLYQDWQVKYRNVFSGGNANALPAPNELKAQLAARILNGEQNYNGQQIAIFRRALQQYAPTVLQAAEKIADNKSKNNL